MRRTYGKSSVVDERMTNEYNPSVSMGQVHVSDLEAGSKNIFIYRLVFALVGILGAFYSFKAAYSIQVNNMLIFIWLVLVTGCMYILFCSDEKSDVNILTIIYRHIRMIRIIFFLIVILCAVVFSDILLCSLYGLINEMNVGVHFDEGMSSTLFMIYATLAMSVVQMLLLRYKRPVLSGTWLLLYAVVPLIFGGNIGLFNMLLIVMSIMGQIRIEAQYGGYAGKVAGMLSVTVILVYLLVIIVYPSRHFNGTTMMSSLADKISDGIFPEEQQEEVMVSGGVSNGKLGTYDKIIYSHKRMLMVTTGYKGNMYLKGFTGSRYENNAWLDFSESTYKDNEAVFDTLEAYAFDTYNQSSQLLDIIDNDEQLMTELGLDASSYVKQVFRRGYNVFYADASRTFWYIPYGNTVDVGKDKYKDTYPANNTLGYINGNQYLWTKADYDLIKNVVDEYSGSNQAMRDYVEAERHYREYVYSNYTGVSQQVKEYIDNAKHDVPEYSGVNDAMSTREYLGQLRKYFDDNYEYTLEPGAVPEGQDFVGYFLDETMKGYCTYFASAATLILRDAGIPTRYVEGYKFNTSQSESGEGASVTKNAGVTELRRSKVFNYNDAFEQYTVEVDDSKAHAWVEVYMDGFGWVPFDMTPGNDNEQPVAQVQSDLHYNMQNDALDITKDNSSDNIKDDSDLTEDSINNSVNDAETNGDENVSSDDPAGESVKNDNGLPVVPKKQYDSISEYMKDNTIKRIDFSIVIPIIGRKLLKVMLVLLKIALALVVVCVIIYIPARYLEKKKKQLFTVHPDNTPEQDKEQVIRIYVYVEKLGAFLKVTRTDTMSYSEYAGILKKRYDYFGDAGIDNIINAVTKVSFGHGNIGRAEMAAVLMCVNEVSRKAYDTQGKVNKLLYRFFYHL